MDDHLEDIDDDEDWLGGLRAAGLPMRQPASLAGPSPGLRQLLDEATPSASAGLRELVASSLAASTRAAYEKDWRNFALFCRVHGHGDPLDPTALVVGEYINDLVRDYKAYATITRRVAAIGFCQQLATAPKPPATPSQHRTHRRPSPPGRA